MRQQAPPYLILPRDFSDKDADRAIQKFEDQEKREEFYKFYRRLQNLYDILSPDAFLRGFIEDYRRLAELYGLLRNAYGNIYADRELTAKTREMLRAQTTLTRLEAPGAIHTLGPAELAALKRSDTSDTTKVLNLRKVLAEAVVREGGSKPFLIPIGERAAKVAEAYESRQMTTQQALDLFTQLAQEAVDSTAEQRRLGVDENTYAILVALKPIVEGVAPSQAGAVNELFGRFPRLPVG